MIKGDPEIEEVGEKVPQNREGFAPKPVRRGQFFRVPAPSAVRSCMSRFTESLGSNLGFVSGRTWFSVMACTCVGEISVVNGSVSRFCSQLGVYVRV